MVLDGVMVIIACLCLTIMHPGIGIGRKKWAQASFPFRLGRERPTLEDNVEITEREAPKPKMAKYRSGITAEEKYVGEVRE